MTNQMDMFVGKGAGLPIKDEQFVMAYPWFSLSKNARFDPIIFENDRGVHIEIHPGAKGIANIWDADMILYAESLINDRVERGLPVSRRMRFSAYDFLKFSGRGTGGNRYQLLDDSIFRLRSTVIKTSIETDGESAEGGFGWIDNYRVIRKDGRMERIEITLNEWLYRAIVKDRRVLTISPQYFKLKKGIERKLYMIARKHCGNELSWSCGLTTLWQKCGSGSSISEFKRSIKTVIQANRLPGYTMALVPAGPNGNGYGKGRQKITFLRRASGSSTAVARPD